MGDERRMTKEELKNQIIELKEISKKLAEEYRERYNQDKEDKIALNMFYHNVISYNDYESVLALIENRNSMIMCFSAPPVLTEETVEVNLKRIAELEKDKDYFSDALDKQIEATLKLQKENEEAKNLIEELASSLSVVGECDEEECELIDKARKFINKPIF